MMKTFGGKPLQREPKHGSENFVRAHVLEGSSTCGASIENLSRRICARGAPIEPREVLLC